MARNSIPVTVTLSPAIYEQMNQEAEKMGMNRSAFVTLALHQYFKSTQALYAVDQLKELLAKVEQVKDESQMSLYQAGGNQ